MGVTQVGEPSHLGCLFMIEDQEQIANVINGVDSTDGLYECSDCKQHFGSPIEVRWHKKHCTGVPGKREFKTRRLIQREITGHPIRQVM